MESAPSTDHFTPTKLNATYLNDFYYDFGRVYVYFGIALCIFGTITNLGMALVLTRPSMTSVINRWMSLIALTDAALMFTYLVHLAHYKLAESNSPCPIELMSLPWAIFQVFYANCSVFTRAFGLWLSVLVSGYRKYTMVSFDRSLYTDKIRAAHASRKYAFYVFVLVAVFSVPIFLQNQIRLGDEPPPWDSTCPRNHVDYYIVRPPDYAYKHNALFLKAAFWINGVALKLAPCCLLAYYLIFITVLIKRHGGRTTKSEDRRRRIERKRADKSNSMSIILCSIFLVTFICEMPHAIISVALVLEPDTESLTQQAYSNLGDVFDLMSLLQCNLTSIVYCVLSTKFRKTLMELTDLKTQCAWCKGMDSATSGSVKDKRPSRRTQYDERRKPLTYYGKKRFRSAARECRV